MIRSFTLLAAAFLAFSSSFSQNVLQLTRPGSGEVHVLREGSFVVFRLNEDNTVREGYIREIQDSTLSFEDLLFEQQVPLSSITILGGATKSKANAGRVTHAVGNALILAGLTAFDCGMGFMFHSDYYYWPVGGTIWLAGAMIAGIGHVIDWGSRPMGPVIRVKNYREWNARIVRESDQKVISDVPEKQVAPADSSAAKSAEPAKRTRKKKQVTGDDVYGE